MRLGRKVTQKALYRMRGAQRAMEHAMLKIKFIDQDLKSEDELRYKIEDRTSELKWS